MKEKTMNLIQRIYRLLVNLKQGTRRLICTIIVSLAALFCLSPMVNAATFYVDGSSGSDSNSGASWVLAFETIQKALAEAATGGPHVIWVAQGTYYPDVGPGQTAGDRDSTFDLVSTVEMYGGFFGDELDLDERDPAEFITILSGAITDPWEEVCGEGNGDCFEAHENPGCQDAACCATVCEIDPLCCLEGFEWTEGCVDIADANCTGGEVPYGAYHVVTATDVDNTTRIDGFTITLGSAGGDSNNSRGGGVFIDDASPAVIRCVIAGNVAGWAIGEGEGGGIHIGGTSDVAIINCTFHDNSAREGGALHLEYGVADAQIVNSLFHDNDADDHGGAIDAASRDPAVIDVINCTFVNNSAGDEEGGAIRVEDPEVGDGPTVLITNCILWDNSPDQIEEIGGELTVRYSNVQGSWAGTENINAAPTFGPGADNYRLVDDSRGVDEGNNSDVPCDAFDVDNDGDDCTTPQDTPDLDLGVRIVSGTVDMGAYESVPCPADIDGDCKVDVKDLLFMLGTWGPCGDCDDCPADLDGSCAVDVKDLLVLVGAWGPCQCAEGPPPPSLREAVEDAGLDWPDDWDEFEEVMTNPESSQEEKDNYYCWMNHYLNHCTGMACTTPNCPDDAPFGHHE